MENTDKFLVTVKEAARVLGMGRSSLYRLAKAGRVPSYSAGPSMSGVRFNIAEVLEALRRPSLPTSSDMVEV